MNTQELNKELNRMGKGWFVLRLANDLLKTNYDVEKGYADNSLKTKQSSYKRTLPFSKRLLTIVKNSPSSLLGVETLGITSAEIKEVIKNLDAYFAAKKPIKHLKTKAARGIAAGDVSNPAIRNILSGLSEISDEEIYDSEEFFDWKCPYTGRDLKAEILGDRKNVQLDHIVPQNREYCGLNIAGNLIYVDKSANSKKGDKNFEEFINSLDGVSDDIKKERIKKIKDFQKLYGYNPEKMRQVISPELKRIYKEVCDKQQEYIDSIAKLLNK